jgi:hypothetical protein
MNEQILHKLIARKELICRAITEHKSIHFIYSDNFERKVEPFCCGISTKENYVARCYQTGGYSSSNKFGWKLYDLAEMSDLRITNEPIQTNRFGYNPKDSAMIKIFCYIKN